jgi:hypothetical protein
MLVSTPADHTRTEHCVEEAQKSVSRELELRLRWHRLLLEVSSLLRPFPCAKTMRSSLE